MSILNQPKPNQDEVTDKLRGAIVHRGLWMGLILAEAKERGLDWEQIGHAAVMRTGCIHGEGIKARMDVPGSLISFANAFFTEDIKKIFEIEVKKLDEDVLEVEYGYCPLVTAWLQAGLEEKMLSTLCDIAMSGDRGICSHFDEFEFHLGKTIARGHRVCEVSFTRKKAD